MKNLDRFKKVLHGLV